MKVMERKVGIKMDKVLISVVKMTSRSDYDREECERKIRDCSSTVHTYRKCNYRLLVVQVPFAAMR